ncbi:class I SAM-dependent methyltransferase [Halorarius litoreus]|uniref:class I SAM-dependent methyltransferase n=1 Tax=Halorarius litoreus TaxID=2962676 RepID=UPI0020CCAC62|nr:class I SAM-dependent methyltransferase [Halorarius litoreus]
MDRFQNTRLPDLDWWARLWPTPGETLRRLGVGPGDAFVEVGSGDGYFALPAARVVDPAPVYALDVDERLLTDLERWVERQGIENVVTVHGDARELAGTLPERVDVVFIANTLHGVEDPAAFVKQAYEALRPGGRFVVINWHDRPPAETTVEGKPRGPPADLRLSPNATVDIVRAVVPFRQVRQVDLPPHHYGLVFERE